MQRFQWGCGISAFIVLISLFFQSCDPTTYSSPLTKDLSTSESESESGSEGSGEEEELESSTSEDEEEGGLSKRRRKQPQRFIENPTMELQKSQYLHKANKKLQAADSRKYVSGSGIMGRYKWDTVIEFQEVSPEDYFKRELDARLMKSSSRLRTEKKESKSKAERTEIMKKHAVRAVKGSPSPGGKNITPVNVRLRIVNDSSRIVSLHQSNDISAIFHKKDTKEQGASSYRKLANRFAKILKTQEDKQKLVRLVRLATVEKKEIQEEYDQLSDPLKDYLLDFIGIQVAELSRAYFHAKSQEHLQFNLDAIHNALKELETNDFREVYVKQKRKFAPFAGKGGAKFYREGFLKSITNSTTLRRKRARKLDFESFSKDIPVSFPNSEEQTKDNKDE